MALLRVLLTMLLTVLALALLAAWLVVPRLDPNLFRADLIAIATERLGRSVRIDGPIHLELLPEPTLTAADVAFGSGDGLSVTATELRLRLALGALAAGRIDARELVLRGAQMHLPWPLDPAELMVRTPRWLSALSAQVEDGKLAIGGLSFSGIDATLTTDAYTGTYTAAGTAHVTGQEWRFTARLTQPGRDGSAGLDVALDGQGPAQGIGATLTGQIASDGTVAGRVTGRGPDLSRVLPGPPVTFKAEGRVTIAGGLAAADDLAMEIGGSPVRGAVALRVAPTPRLDVALAASRLDLDAWLPVLVKSAAFGLPTGVDLSAEAAAFAGGTLRGLRAAVDFSNAGADIREARAILPGDAPLRLSGHVAPPEGATGARARFEGDVSLSAPSLRTTLAWAQRAGVSPLGMLPAGVLRTADVTAHVIAEPTQLAVGALEGTVDGSHVAGSLSLRGGARFALGAGLAVDRLDLDPWLPADAPALHAIPASFAPFDANLRLEAKQALFHGITISPMSFDAGAEGGRVTLRRMDLQVNGVHATASATVGAGGVVSEGRLDLQAPEAQPLAALLPESLAYLGHRAPRLWRAAANVQVLGAGAPDHLGLKVTADLADLRLEAQPVVDLSHGTWTAAMTLRHPGAPRLAEALGLVSAPAWLGDGSLGLIAQLSGEPGRMSADSFELTAGSLHATGGLALDRAAAVPRLTGHVAAETLPLPLPYARAVDPLPITALRGLGVAVQLDAEHVLAGLSPVLEHAAGTVVVADGVLRIDALTARLGGGKLAGAATLDTAASVPQLTLMLALSDATIAGGLFDEPLDLTTGVLTASVAMTASGHSPAALLSTLTGDIRLGVRDGTLTGIAMAKLDATLSDTTVRGALGGGVTPFQALAVQAHAERGVVTVTDATLASAAGRALMSGALDLPGGSADLRLAIRPAVPDPPEIGLRLGGPLDALKRTPELANVMTWRSAHAGSDASPATP